MTTLCGSCAHPRHSGPCRRRRSARPLLLAGAVLLALTLAPLTTAQADDGAVLQSIAYWSAAYGLDPGAMIAVAECESSLNPDAYNPSSGASGLYQFDEATYAWGVSLLMSDDSYAPHLDAYDPETRSLWSADASAHIAVYLFYRGYSYLWACAS